MTLTQEAKAEAIKLAMQIDLGQIDTCLILDFINKDPKLWAPIIGFWLTTSPMTKMVVERLALETLYLKS